MKVTVGPNGALKARPDHRFNGRKHRHGLSLLRRQGSAGSGYVLFALSIPTSLSGELIERYQDGWLYRCELDGDRIVFTPEGRNC